MDSSTTLGQYISGVNTTTGNLQAAVNTEQAARENGDTANASAITAVSAATLNANPNLLVNPTGDNGTTGWSGVLWTPTN